MSDSMSPPLSAPQAAAQLFASDNESGLWAQAARHPALLLIVAAYAILRRYSAEAIGRAGPWGPRWLARLVARFFSRLLGFVGAPIVSHDQPPPPFDASRQHVVVWHPHGAYSTMAPMHCGQLSVTAQPLTWYPGVAPVLFQVPLLREALLLLNARSVTGKVVERLAAAGLNVGVQPGGIPEQLQSDHRREIAFFAPKLGFIRLAMRHGAPLLPAYIFGENQAYTTSDLGRRLSHGAHRYLGMPFVPVLGKWYLPWLVPKPTQIHVRWGAPVPVGPPNDDPTDAEVEAVYEAYVAELLRVFDKHKDACLPPDVAARGLTIVKRERRKKDFTTGVAAVASKL